VNPSQDKIQNKPARAAWTRFIPALVMVAVLALLAVGLLTQTDDAKSVLEGRPAPALSGVTLEGKNFDAALLKGKPMVINFWASWCDPCREEAPLFKELVQKYGSQVNVVGVLHTETSYVRARAFAQEFGYTFPSIQNDDRKLSFDFGVTAPPETFFVDASGMVVKRWIGPVRPEVMRENLERLGVKL